jgi:nitroreductase
MAESKRADKRRISRRAFLRKMTVYSAAALAGTNLLEACSPPPATPTIAPTAPLSVKPSPAPATPTTAPTAQPAVKPTPVPATTNPATLSEALKKRKSATAFQPQPLPKEKLLDLLWAAWGVNRPDSGKRTAPSAINAQEIDIYVLTAEGAFVYDAKANQLTAVVAQDLRAKATTAGSMRDAAAHLVFVADHAKLRTGSQSQKELYSACHTGFIGQNVYLYCAAEGLGARFYAGVDRAALKESLKLRNEQAIVFAQAVGYAKE